MVLGLESYCDVALVGYALRCVDIEDIRQHALKAEHGMRAPRRGLGIVSQTGLEVEIRRHGAAVEELQLGVLGIAAEVGSALALPPELVDVAAVPPPQIPCIALVAFFDSSLEAVGEHHLRSERAVLRPELCARRGHLLRIEDRVGGIPRPRERRRGRRRYGVVGLMSDVALARLLRLLDRMLAVLDMLRERLDSRDREQDPKCRLPDHAEAPSSGRTVTTLNMPACM